MIQEIGNRKFDNQYKTDAVPRDGDCVFAFKKAEKGPDLILLGTTEDGAVRAPLLSELRPDCEHIIYLFSIDETQYWMLKPGEEIDAPDGYAYESNRVLRKSRPKDVCFAAMTACHLNTWYKDNQYCGRCGSKTVHSGNERMMSCPECGNMIFPKICPAVTVALRHEDKLLVSRYRGRVQTNSYALIAGFVEIGESAEECVAREVMEEVGLKATNIRYYASQPWGFAGNLQIGYVADVEGSSEIRLDENELASAFFISRDELEPNDNRPALTQEMIEDFRIGRL